MMHGNMNVKSSMTVDDLHKLLADTCNAVQKSS